LSPRTLLINQGFFDQISGQFGVGCLEVLRFFLSVLIGGKKITWLEGVANELIS
jgi:hypothetical protein